MDIGALCSRCGKIYCLTEDTEKVAVEFPDTNQLLGLDPSPGIALSMTMLPEVMEDCW